MKQADLTEEKIAALKEKFGKDLRVFEAPNGDVVVLHKPSQFVWSRWIAQVSDDKRNKEESLRTLVTGCLAAPDEVTALALFDEYPAMPTGMSETINEMGGGSLDPKKL